VDGTGTGPCSVVGFAISGSDSPASFTKELVITAC